MDEFTDLLFEKDTTSHFISNILVRMEPETGINALEFVLDHLPSFVDTSSYVAFAKAMEPEAVEAQMDANYELLMNDETGDVTQTIAYDPLNLREAIIGDMLEGVMNGHTLIDGHFFSPDSTVAIAATYYNGRPDGIRRDFDSTGKITNGYLFEDGWLRYEGITDLNGLRQGLWKEYYPTGELRSQGKYKNSKPVGQWKFFFPDKTVEIVGDYNQKGQKHGEWVWFYPSGDTMTVSYYEDGDLDGPYVEYDEEGQPVTRGEYVAGYEEGVWYYRNGTSVETGRYDGGKRTGLWTTTYSDDQVAAKINYDQDVRDGKYTAFWENGNIKTTGKYTNGLQDGTWIQYTEEGVQFLTTLFKDGKEIKWNNYTIK